MILLCTVPSCFIQFLLLEFAERIVVKLIPVYIFVICAVFLIMMYVGAFGTWSGDMISNGHTIVAVMLGRMLGFAFVGDIAAWGIYLINSKKAKKEGSKKNMEVFLTGLIIFEIPALIIQLLFCKFAKHMVFKLIPVYVDVICAVLLVMMYFGAFGTWSGGFMIANGHEFTAGLLGTFLGIAFIGDIVAWCIYLSLRKTLKKENEKIN